MANIHPIAQLLLYIQQRKFDAAQIRHAQQAQPTPVARVPQSVIDNNKRYISYETLEKLIEESLPTELNAEQFLRQIKNTFQLALVITEESITDHPDNYGLHAQKEQSEDLLKLLKMCEKYMIRKGHLDGEIRITDEEIRAFRQANQQTFQLAESKRQKEAHYQQILTEPKNKTTKSKK